MFSGLEEERRRFRRKKKEKKRKKPHRGQGSRLFGATISAPPISLPVVLGTGRFCANSVFFDSSVI